jgi:mortality factor 4-like protein 1
MCVLLFGSCGAAIILYFDRSLAPFLLYRFERLQLRKYLHERPAEDKRALCQVYGAEHLLRLFMKLPKLLSHANLAEKDAAVLMERVNHLVAWLDGNRSRYFTSDYVRASAAYAAEVAALAESMRSPWE